MTNERSRGLFGRLSSLIRGIFAIWVRDSERQNPRAVYEQAINERTTQYRELKEAVAGILYMRNKLGGELEDRRAELARTQEDIRRAVQRGEDEVAMALISHRHALLEDLERTEKELEQTRHEVDAAKTNLVRFRNEIRTLEREKIHMMARLANARARRQVQEAFDGLSLDSEMRALEQVREYIARLDTEGRLDQELGDREAAARVLPLRSGLVDDAHVAGAVGPARERFLDRRELLPRLEPGVAVQREPGRVTQQAAQRHAARIELRLGQVPARQRLLDRRVELQSAFLHETHQPPRRRGLDATRRRPPGRHALEARGAGLRACTRAGSRQRGDLEQHRESGCDTRPVCQSCKKMWPPVRCTASVTGFHASTCRGVKMPGALCQPTPCGEMAVASEMIKPADARCA